MTREDHDKRLAELDDWSPGDLMMHIILLEAALAPFAKFARNVDVVGWTSNIHREPISYWFGPSDFRKAGEVLPQADDN